MSDINAVIDRLRWSKRVKYIRDELVLHNPQTEQVSQLWEELDDLLSEMTGKGDFVPDAADPINLPSNHKYTVYPSVSESGKALLWDASARHPRSGQYVAGASADTPLEALIELTKLMKGLGDGSVVPSTGEGRSVIEVFEGVKGGEVDLVWGMTKTQCILVGIATNDDQSQRLKENAAKLPVFRGASGFVVKTERVSLDHLYGFKDSMQVWHTRTVQGGE